MTWTPTPDPSDVDRVMRAFVRDGRIVSWPAKWSRKLVLLDWVAQAFEPGRTYAEREVDEVLTAYADDHVTLRRYLVDAGMLDRSDGWYWRSGGSYDV
jgi:hypothetical protein